MTGARLLFRSAGGEIHGVALRPGPDGGFCVDAAGGEVVARLGRPAGKGAVWTILLEVDGHPARALVAREGRQWWVAAGGEVAAFGEAAPDDEPSGRAAQADREAVTPIPGRVVRLHVAAGDRVEAGAVVASIEAMKMEHPVRAPRAGRVAQVHVAPGDRVDAGQVLLALVDPP